MQIKLVIFDGAGVIYSYKKAIKVFEREYDKFLRKFNTSLKEQGKLWLKFYPKTVRGKISLRKTNEIILSTFGIPKSKVREWLKRDKEITLKFVKLNKGIKQLLSKLKSKGIKVAVLSDTVHPLKWRLDLFKKFGLTKGRHYDKLFLSSQIGYEKPEPQAYLTVLNNFKVKPEEALFVGHDKEELIGAKKLGIKTISYRGYRKADFYAKNFKEILKLVS